MKLDWVWYEFPKWRKIDHFLRKIKFGTLFFRHSVQLHTWFPTGSLQLESRLSSYRPLYLQPSAPPGTLRLWKFGPQAQLMFRCQMPRRLCFSNSATPVAVEELLTSRTQNRSTAKPIYLLETQLLRFPVETRGKRQSKIDIPSW